MSHPRQVSHSSILAFLLCRDSVKYKVKPFSDRGEQGVLHLQDNVVPGSPLESVENVEPFQDCLQLCSVLGSIVTNIQTVLPGNDYKS